MLFASRGISTAVSIPKSPQLEPGLHSRPGSFSLTDATAAIKPPAGDGIPPPCDTSRGGAANSRDLLEGSREQGSSQRIESAGAAGLGGLEMRVGVYQRVHTPIWTKLPVSAGSNAPIDPNEVAKTGVPSLVQCPLAMVSICTRAGGSGRRRQYPRFLPHTSNY
jgi:hypothetical protein